MSIGQNNNYLLPQTEITPGGKENEIQTVTIPPVPLQIKTKLLNPPTTAPSSPKLAAS